MRIGLRKKVIGLCSLVMLLLMVGSCHAATSVVLDGWKFMLNSEGWRTYDPYAPEPYDSSSPKWQSPCGVQGTWKGDLADAFYYPSYPNAPKGNDEYESLSALVTIWVMKAPEDLRTQLQDHDVAVYGSVDKIPEDARKKETDAILADATRNAIQCETYFSEKDISFNDREAHLSEGEDIGRSDGAIAVALDNNTVGLIEVYVYNRNGPVAEDAALFDGRAWDVINAITVESA